MLVPVLVHHGDHLGHLSAAHLARVVADRDHALAVERGHEAALPAKRLHETSLPIIGVPLLPAVTNLLADVGE
jgi:hypothetical protein